MRLFAAAITHQNEDMLTVLTLLSEGLQNPLAFIDFEQPEDISLDNNIHYTFIAISDVGDITRLINHFEAAGIGVDEMPAILHLTDPSEIERMQYGAVQDFLPITPLPQAVLDVMDVTLNYQAFHSYANQFWEPDPS